jgi:hypothetical protein
MINNYFRPGPNTPANHLPLAVKAENRGATKVYLAGNFFEGADPLNQDGAKAIDFHRWAKGNYLTTTPDEILVDSEFDLSESTPATQSARDIYEAVLDKAGASLVRDAADARLVNGIRDRMHRMIDSQEQVGGWPALESKSPNSDRDRDGMPDQWEVQHGLNPDGNSDGNGDRDNDGYTNLEEYLNSLVAN